MNILRDCPSPRSILQAAFDALYAASRVVDTRDENRPWQLDDYGIDSTSAFFPREPLGCLPAVFHAWEEALLAAPDALRLGTDDSPEALALQDIAEQWRLDIRSVSK